MPQHKQNEGSLGKFLAVVFVIALVMGPGIGVYLVNPDPVSEDSVLTFLGMPIIYAWALVWYGVMVTVVVTAYLKVWDRDDDSGGTPHNE